MTEWVSEQYGYDYDDDDGWWMMDDGYDDDDYNGVSAGLGHMCPNP